jgi:hypothetical protein
MAIIHDFKSIKRILDRQEQKAEFEAKQPARFIRTMSGHLVSVDDAMKGPPDLGGRVFTGVRTGGTSVPMDQMGSTQAGRLSGGSCESVTLATAQLPPYTPTGSYVAPEGDPA